MTTPDKPEGKTSDHGLLLMNASNIPGYLTELKRKADFADEMAKFITMAIEYLGGGYDYEMKTGREILKRYRGE